MPRFSSAKEIVYEASGSKKIKASAAFLKIMASFLCSTRTARSSSRMLTLWYSELHMPMVTSFVPHASYRRIISARGICGAHAKETRHRGMMLCYPDCDFTTRVKQRAPLLLANLLAHNPPFPRVH